MQIPIMSKVATEIIEMLIWGAEQDRRVSLEAGLGTSPKSIGILIGAISMWKNPTAIKNLADKASISGDDAALYLQRCKMAGREVAVQYGFNSIVDLVDYGQIRSN